MPIHPLVTSPTAVYELEGQTAQSHISPPPKSNEHLNYAKSRQPRVSTLTSKVLVRPMGAVKSTPYPEPEPFLHNLIMVCSYVCKCLLSQRPYATK